MINKLFNQIITNVQSGTNSIIGFRKEFISIFLLLFFSMSVLLNSACTMSETNHMMKSNTGGNEEDKKGKKPNFTETNGIEEVDLFKFSVDIQKDFSKILFDSNQNNSFISNDNELSMFEKTLIDKQIAILNSEVPVLNSNEYINNFRNLKKECDLAKKDALEELEIMYNKKEKANFIATYKLMENFTNSANFNINKYLELSSKLDKKQDDLYDEYIIKMNNIELEASVKVKIKMDNFFCNKEVVLFSWQRELSGILKSKMEIVQKKEILFQNDLQGFFNKKKQNVSLVMKNVEGLGIACLKYLDCENKKKMDNIAKEEGKNRVKKEEKKADLEIESLKDQNTMAEKQYAYYVNIYNEEVNKQAKIVLSKYSICTRTYTPPKIEYINGKAIVTPGKVYYKGSGSLK